MDLSEMKKLIIRETITAFFKANGFNKKGAKYFRTADNSIIQAEVQSQKYYTGESAKNFRISISIYPNIESNLPIPYVFFGRHEIMSPESSWITINENTDVEEMKTKLEAELNKAFSFIKRDSNLKKMMAKGVEEISNIKKTILELKSRLEKESSNQNLIYVLNNEIKKTEKRIDILRGWLKLVGR